MDANGFTPILSIFYAVFHPTAGSQVLCQVPKGSIVPEPPDADDDSALATPLFDFDWVKNYVIPKPQLCNRLVGSKVNNYRIVGHPVYIYAQDTYKRNSFYFNFVFVFSAEADSAVYEMPIRRLGKMFMALEEQSGYLSKESSLKQINNIIEQIYQDVNNYSECMIPIDDSNAVNMKLFPIFPAPPDLDSCHVPISTVQLDRLVDANWDPTMENIVPFINGINSIQQIADLAEANYNLTKQCIQHLVHYRCLIITDLFQFSNIYAVTSSISDFLSDPNMFRECQAYVFNPERVAKSDPNNVPVSSSYSSNSSFSAAVRSNKPPSQATLFYLYKTLHQGQTVKEWYTEHRKLLMGIDVRRFLSFGVIKGLIYRVHSYPICELGTRRRHTTIPANDLQRKLSEKVLDLVIDAPRHFDSICTSLGMSSQEIEALLTEHGDWSIVNC